MATFAYTPDPKDPSKNKLDISDAKHTAMAVAALGPKGFRGNKVSIPEKDLPAVKKKVAAAYKKYFPEKDVPTVLKALDVKVNDADINDPALLSSIISAITCFFRNKEWQAEYDAQNEEDAEEYLEDAGILTEDDPDESSNYMMMKSLKPEVRQGTFVVLQADVVDLQGDTYTAEEVSKACHNFNVNCRKAFIDHSEETDQASIVESYLAPADMLLDDQLISKGDWLAVVQFEPDMWKEVKKGRFNGLSIGAYAKIEKV